MADDERDTVQLSAYVDPAVKQQVRVQAAEAGMNMSEWVREAVREKLREGEEGNGDRLRPVAAD